MDSFFPFFFFFFFRNSYWIFFSPHTRRIKSFQTPVQTRLVDFYRFSSPMKITRYILDPPPLPSPLVKLTRAQHETVSRCFDPRISYHRDLLLTNIYVPVSKFFPPETWKLVDGGDTPRRTWTPLSTGALTIESRDNV